MNKTRTIRAEGLKKSYNKRMVSDIVSLEVTTGQAVGLLGPNGAGKTTAFYMLSGIIAADAGQIYIDDINITDKPLYKRARNGIGYLPQEASVFRGLNVRENVMAAIEIHGALTTRTEKNALADKLLTEFGLETKQHILGMSLSGGEKRRVEIARALASDPDFLLLDEPFAGVDPVAVNDIIDTISTLKKSNIGVLITDHNVRETLRICDRAYVLNAGQILARGTPEDIVQHQTVREVFLGENFRL